MIPYVSMVACESREAITEDSARAISERGGLFQSLHLHYFGRGKIDVPPQWVVHKRPKHPSVMLYDAWQILMAVPFGHDWIFLEDDVTPCKNALRFVAQFPIPDDVGLMSFFDLRKEWPNRTGIFYHPQGRDLWGSQAVKIPAKVVHALQRVAVELRMFEVTVWDTWFSRAIWPMGLRLANYSPSLFQHTGMVPVHPSGGKDRPTAINFPGEDFDAYDQWNGVTGTWSKPRRFMCPFHKVTHASGFVCPAGRAMKGKSHP